MSFHSNETGSSLHVLNAFTYANAAARLGASGLVSADVGKLALQSDTKNYYILQNHSPVTWSQVTGGGGGGGGGINFVGLDSALSPSNQDDRNAENSVGNWVAYADAAGSAPVDMTGGAPVVTVARTTTGGEVLNGSSSFKVVKDAANRQGQGVSVATYVVPAYSSSNIHISMPFKLLSGSLVQGDIKVFIYDMTNSQVVTPTNNDVIGSSGIVNADCILAPNTAQIRVGLHFASTSATAVSLSFDDVSVGPSTVAPTGLAGTDWQPYTITPTGSISNPVKGTVTVDNAEWRRVGDSLQIRWSYIQTSAGTAGSGDYLINLPAGLVIDSSKMNIGSGTASAGGVGSLMLGSTAGNGRYNLVATNSTHLLGLNDALSQTWDSTAGAGGFGNASLEISLLAQVPIVGWSSNLTLSSSSQYNISTLLAGGTRVVGTAPTALGEYRSYLRNAGASTYTETNGTPAITPSSVDGILMYAGNGSASADTNNQPSRYEIFVGKNKNVKWEFYSSAGRTGQSDVDVYQSGAISIGCHTGYDPTTGIAWITNAVSIGVSTSQFTSVDSLISAASSTYFDVKVSENALGVGLARKPAVSLTQTAGSLSLTANVAPLWDTILYDELSSYNSATGLFTAPSSGIYLITGAVQWGTGGTAQVYKNGVALLNALIQVAPGIVAYSTPLTMQVKLNASDTLFVGNTTTQSLGGAGSSHVEICKLFD